jgi:CPA1 family monovalent cation:H+ antiporter
VLTTAIAIAARFIWVFPATYVPRWLIPSLARRDPAPRWQFPFLLGFTGVRGVVSLAAALAIPYTIANGQPFPHRDLILFVTYGVIVLTLVGQGMMLPFVVQWLGLTKLGKLEHADELKSELHARQAALKEVKKRLEKAIKDHELPDEAADHLRTRNQSRLQVLPTNLTEGLNQMRKTAALKLELISAERDFIYQLLRDGKITDEARRRIEYELDLEEAGVANRGRDGGGWM